jgi:co-chaperonin GroES (HSP10)
MMMTEAVEKTPAMLELEQKRAALYAEQEKALAELEAAIPKPTGYHLLIALPEVEEEFDGGILKATKTMKEELILSSIGLVLDMGDQAYADENRFPTGPWCKAGDYVMFRPNSGTRFRIGTTEYRLLNDDSVQAIVPNPRVVARAI